MIDIVDQLASLNLAIQGFEARTRPSDATIEKLVEAKRGVDDMRLHLWAVLNAVHANDSKTFEERFRVQRTAELCARLATDLQLGKMNADHAEFADLWIAVNDLSQAIESTRKPPP
jgi:hypothetical protein